MLFGERSCVRQLYRNTLMTDFVRAFNNDHNNIYDAVQQNQSTGYSFIRQMHFYLALFALTLFHTSQNPPQVSVKTFYAN